MNELWFATSQKERLARWRKFRKTLLLLPIEESLQACVDWWKQTPISSNVFDPFSPETWLGPWDLIWESNFDENSVALGMAYSIHLENIAECELLLVQQHENNQPRLVVLVDNQYVLNYSYGTITSFNVLDDCDILYRKKLE